MAHHAPPDTPHKRRFFERLLDYEAQQMLDVSGDELLAHYPDILPHFWLRTDDRKYLRQFVEQVQALQQAEDPSAPPPQEAPDVSSPQ